MAETWLLATRCPGYRWLDSSLGSGMELENLFGGGALRSSWVTDYPELFAAAIQLEATYERGSLCSANSYISALLLASHPDVAPT